MNYPGNPNFRQRNSSTTCFEYSSLVTLNLLGFIRHGDTSSRPKGAPGEARAWTAIAFSETVWFEAKTSSRRDHQEAATFLEF